MTVSALGPTRQECADGLEIAPGLHQISLIDIYLRTRARRAIEAGPSANVQRPLSRLIPDAKEWENTLSSTQDRKSGTASDQEEDTAPEPEQPSSSAAEASSKASAVVDAIDEVLEEFDDLTLEELGYEKGEVVDPEEIDEAIAKKIRDFKQKGGQ